MKIRSLLAGGILVASMATSDAAFADAQYVAAISGPVRVPNVPVMACNGASCQSTPPLSSVGLRVGALAEARATPPTFVPGSCPSGVGTAVVVRGGSSGAIVTATLFGTRPDGAAYEQAVGFPVLLGANGTVTVQACA